MSARNTRPNPYVGPRAFETGEKLYGRDREVRQLLDLLIAERIVLLYSPSGAGKTSLVRAGLIPRLAAEGFHVLPVIRVSQEPPAGTRGDGDALPAMESSENTPAQPGPAEPVDSCNRYIFSTLLSLEEGLPEDQQTPVEQLFNMSLEEYLGRRPHLNGGGEPPESELHTEVLIFDQFEEILTLDPIDQACKAAFFAQVGAVLRDHRRWALFSIREDYVAALDPYLRPVPTRLTIRNRLDLLGVEAARQAIQPPASQAGVEFADSAACQLLDDLRRVQVQRPDGTMEEQLGPYVEPVQLQVVCYRLWQNLAPEDVAITEKDLDQVGDVNQSLSEYYAERVSAIAQETSVNERAIRDWFEHKLITEGGIRSQVLMGYESSEGLENRAISRLEDAHLIRAEKRRGATWFELAHDRLIWPVRANNENWYATHLSLLQRQATLWLKDGQPDHLLLRDQTLEQAEAWVGEHSAEMTPFELDFLEACRAARLREQEQRALEEQAIKIQEQARSAKKLRQRLIMALVALVAAVFFASAAFYTGNQARVTSYEKSTLAVQNATNAGVAQAASTEAVGNAATAQANASVAETARAAALSDRAAAVAAEGTAQAAYREENVQRSTAVAAQATAQANFIRAEEQAGLARSRQLAAQALGYLPTEPQLASLLAIEAYRAADSREARNVLLTNLQLSLNQLVRPFAGQLIPRQETDLYSVALSPDGVHLAWGTSVGVVVLWNYQTGEAEWVGRKHGANKVEQLDFSPNGKLLASGALDGRIFLWEVATGEAEEIVNFDNIYGLSFGPDGQRLAAGVGGQVFIFDPTTLERLRPPFDYKARLSDVVWSPDGNFLALSGQDGSVSVWDPAGEIPKLRFDEPGDVVRSIAWSPDSTLLASTGEYDRIDLWDVRTGRRAGEPLKGSLSDWSFTSVAISSDGKFLAASNFTGAVVIWDLTSREILNRISFHEEIVQSVAFSPTAGDLLLSSAGLDNQVALFEIIPLQPLNETLLNAPGPVIALSPTERGEILAFIQTNSGASLNQVQADNSEQIFAYNGRISTAAFSSDGAILAVGGSDGVVHLLDAATGRPLSNPALTSPDRIPFLSLALSPDGSALVSSQCLEEDSQSGDRPFCKRHQVFLWDVATGEISQSPALDESSRTNSSGTESISGHRDYIRALALSPSGKILASAGDDRSILLWNLESGLPRAVPLKGHREAITGLAFSPDGQILVSGSVDKTIILWDVSTNQRIGEPLVGAAGSLLSLVFDSSNSLVSGSSDGALLRWEMDPEAWIDRNCELANRNFSQAEWSQFFPQLDYRPTCPEFPAGE